MSDLMQNGVEAVGGAADQLRQISLRFESCGQNCEFGFALRKLGNEDGQLLRWAVVPFDGLINLLRNGHHELYDRTSLRPTADDMVLDERYQVSFHTTFRFKKHSGQWVSTQTVEQQQEAFDLDRSKIEHMALKFGERLQDPNRILVYKSADALTSDMIRIVDIAFAQAAGIDGAQLLLVEENLKAGEAIQQVGKRTFRATLPEFIDNKYAATSDYAVWIDMMVRADRCIPQRIQRCN